MPPCVGYGAVRTAGDPELPTSSNPAVFVLKAKGNPEPLVHIRRQSFRIAKDGTPFDIVLGSVNERSPGHYGGYRAWVELGIGSASSRIEPGENVDCSFRRV